MKIFDQQDFFKLANKSGKYVVSIYVPTERHSSDAYKTERTLFKNMLQKAEEKLETVHQLQSKDARAHLRAGYDLLEDTEFWKYNSDLLAAFFFDGKLETVTVPIHHPKAEFFVSTKAYLLPLSQELQGNGHYYALHLNLDRIRLFEGTKSTFSEVTLDPEEVALSFTEEEKTDENQKNLQAQGGVGKGGAMYHGHGDGADEEKKVTILNYFHRMTNMLEPLLNKNPLPLYLIGVDYLIPLFTQASKYKHLADTHVIGAFQWNQIGQMHAEVWDLARTQFERNKTESNEAFQLKLSKRLAVQDEPLSLIKAALTGAVDTLYVREGHDHISGSYDADKHQIQLTENGTSIDHCLIDMAVSKTLESGGKVFILENGEMPGSAAIAGTLRYELA